jgi:hypothetical protein
VLFLTTASRTLLSIPSFPSATPRNRTIHPRAAHAPVTGLGPAPRFRRKRLLRGRLHCQAGRHQCVVVFRSSRLVCERTTDDTVFSVLVFGLRSFWVMRWCFSLPLPSSRHRFRTPFSNLAALAFIDSPRFSLSPPSSTIPRRPLYPVVHYTKPSTPETNVGDAVDTRAQNPKTAKGENFSPSYLK